MPKTASLNMNLTNIQDTSLRNTYNQKEEEAEAPENNNATISSMTHTM